MKYLQLTLENQLSMDRVMFTDQSCQLKNTFRRNLIVLVAGFCLSLPAVSLHAVDKVYPKNDVPASGQIQSISPTKVVIKVRGSDQTFALNDVQKITFDGEPNSLERARDQYINGQFDQALEEIKKVDPASAKNNVIRQEIEFYRWYCEGKLALGGSGDASAAVKGLRALVSANRNTHHLVDIFGILGQLYLSQGKPKEASQYFNFLTRAPDPISKAMGMYQLAQVELAQDSVDAAKTRFSQLANSSSSVAEVSRYADLSKVGLAICKHKAGDNAGAIQDLDKLVKEFDSSDYEIFARINNAKGTCYQALGKSTDALLSFLQTDFLFSSDPEAHAEALYHLKSLWTEYGNPSKSADAKKRLTSQYASSVWAKKP